MVKKRVIGVRDCIPPNHPDIQYQAAMRSFFIRQTSELVRDAIPTCFGLRSPSPPIKTHSKLPINEPI